MQKGFKPKSSHVKTLTTVYSLVQKPVLVLIDQIIFLDNCEGVIFFGELIGLDVF